MTTPELKKLIADMTNQLVDEGKLIEMGWQGMRHMSIRPDAPEIQLVEMRVAFFAGAQHLFGSLMSAADPKNPDHTQADLDRMVSIDKELAQFVVEFEQYIKQKRRSG